MSERVRQSFNSEQKRNRERTKRINHLLDQVGLDRLAVPLLLDELEHGGRELVAAQSRGLLQCLVEVLLPHDERELCSYVG